MYYFENEKPVKFESEKRPVSPVKPQLRLRDIIPLNDSIESINKDQCKIANLLLVGTNLKRKDKIEK